MEPTFKTNDKGEVMSITFTNAGTGYKPVDWDRMEPGTKRIFGVPDNWRTTQGWWWQTRDNPEGIPPQSM